MLGEGSSDMLWRLRGCLPCIGCMQMDRDVRLCGWAKRARVGKHTRVGEGQDASSLRRVLKLIRMLRRGNRSM